METQQYLNEVAATQIKIGSQFTLSSDLGKFLKGENITVLDIRPSGNDIVIEFMNEQGDKDRFYLDKNDDFEGLI
jgi:hypothetical protein